VSVGRIPDAAGTSITSSKVSACRISIGASFPMAAHYTRASPPQKLAAERGTYPPPQNPVATT
jgi:hypothetical protein